MHTRTMRLVLFTQPWRLFPRLRRFQGQLPWLVEWVFAPGRLLSAKLQTAPPLGRWMRWAKRPILPRACRHLPQPTRYSFLNRQDVSYQLPSICKTFGDSDSMALPNLFECTVYLRPNLPLAYSKSHVWDLSLRSSDVLASSAWCSSGGRRSKKATAK